MPRFTPKGKFVEFLKREADMPIRINQLYAKQIEDVIVRNKPHFTTLYEEMNKDGEYYRTNSKLGTNLPNTSNGYLYLGSFLYGVLNSAFNGKKVSDVITSVPDSNIVNQGEDDSKASDAYKNIYGFLSDVKTLKEVPILRELFTTKTIGIDYETWAKKLEEAILAIDSAYAASFATAAGFVAKTQATKSFIDVLYTYKLGKDDGRVATAWIYTLSRICRLYTRVMCPAESSDDEHDVQYLETERYDLFECLYDVEKLTSVFKKWYAARMTTAFQRDLIECYTMDFSKLEIKNGVARVPASFYDKIIAFGTNNATNKSLDQMKFDAQIANFESNITRIAQLNKILAFENSSIVAPVEFEIVHLDDSFKIDGELQALEAEMRYLLSTCDVIIPLFKEFVNQYFDGSTQKILPVVHVRSAIIDGIESLYRFDFESCFNESFLCSVVQSIGTKKRVVPTNTFSLAHVAKANFADKVKNPLYLRKCPIGGYYGTDDVGVDAKGHSDVNDIGRKNERQFYVDQFRNTKIVKTGISSWSFERDSNIFSIYPPSLRQRDCDVYVAASRRENNGIDFTIKSLDATDASKVSLLDLYFSFAEYELTGGLETLYNSRLKSMGTREMIRPLVIPCDAPMFIVDTPTYAYLLSLCGATNMLTRRRSDMIPRVLGLDPKVAVGKAKSTRFEVTKYVDFDVPLKKSMINTMYLSPNGKTLEPGAEIFKSGVRRQGEPQLKVLNTPPLDLEVYKDYVTIKVRLSLATDVIFKNHVMYDDNDSDSITLIKKLSVPGFESRDHGVSVNPAFDDKYVITNGDGEPVEEKRVLDNALFASSVEGTLVNVIRNLLLEAIHMHSDKVDVAKEWKRIMAWVGERFVVNGDLSLNTIADLRSDLTVRELVEMKWDDVSDDNAIAKSALKIFQEVFGHDNSLPLELPILVHDDYIDILNDSFGGIVRMPHDACDFAIANVLPPESLVRDYHGLIDIIGFYANEKLNSMLN